jgi:acetate kinase
MSGTVLLAINSGSSSLKLGLFEGTQREVLPLARGSADGIGSDRGKVMLQSADGRVLYEEPQAIHDQGHALQLAAAQLTAHGLPSPAAVGHRVVHGGPALREHQRITAQVLKQLEAAVHFAPLHVPAAVALIRKAQEFFPGVPQFACFDTAFHRTLPEAAARFALPERFWDAGVRRYGFHGLSCESILHTLGAGVPGRLIVAHLGNGASITAIANGLSVDTTMGLTPTGGIIMGTRCGDLDPGVLLHILRANGSNVAELEDVLDRQSGLLGISRISRDMRQLHQASGNIQARLAVEMFARSAKKAIAGFAAVLGGLDLLVFTGGIGEHDPAVRAEICDGLECLGVHLDEQANRRNAKNIGGAESRVAVRTLASEEEIQIARHAYRLLSAQTPSTDL